MRKALLVLAICALAAPAWAGGGYSLFGSYGSLNNDGQSGGAGLRLTLGDSRWVGDLTWTWYPSVSGVKTISGFKDNLQMIPTDLGIRILFNPRGRFIPYVGGGLTFFYVNINDGDASNAFGFHAMGGFNIGGGHVKFFAEANYRWAESDVTYRFGGEKFSGTMDVGGFGVNAGLIWTF